MVPQFLTPAQYRDRILLPIGEVTNAMERTGCCVSLDRLRSLKSKADAETRSLTGELLAWAGRDVNWNSWQQLGAFLHTDKKADGGLELEPSPFWKKGEVDLDGGEIKTDDKALEWLAANNEGHRAGINNIRQLRRWQRTANYAEDWLAKAIPFPGGTDRLHPSFGLGSDHDTRPGAVTGRFGVKNPPLNQVPRSGDGPMGELRSAFIPPPGCRLVVVDYSQLEVVLLAHLCRVLFGRGLLADRLAGGRDLHSLTAQYVFGDILGNTRAATAPLEDFKSAKDLKALRNLVKAIRYGLNYGKGARGFGTTLFNADGSPLGEEAAQRLVDGLLGFDPEIPQYQRFVREHIERHSSIISLFGRLVPLPGARSPKMGIRNRAWRQALNYPLQSGGQEVMGFALISIHRDPVLRDLGFELSLVVHDEVVGWAPEDNAEAALRRVEELMVSAVELRAPLLAEGHTGASWSEAK